MNPVDLLVQKWWHRCCASFTTSLLMLHTSPNELAAINKAHCKEPARLQQHPTNTRALSLYTQYIVQPTQSWEPNGIGALQGNTGSAERQSHDILDRKRGKREFKYGWMMVEKQLQEGGSSFCVPPPALRYRCNVSEPVVLTLAMGGRHWAAHPTLLHFRAGCSIRGKRLRAHFIPILEADRAQHKQLIIRDTLGCVRSRNKKETCLNKSWKICRETEKPAANCLLHAERRKLQNKDQFDDIWSSLFQTL